MLASWSRDHVASQSHENHMKRKDRSWCFWHDHQHTWWSCSKTLHRCTISVLHPGQILFRRACLQRTQSAQQSSSKGCLPQEASSWTDRMLSFLCCDSTPAREMQASFFQMSVCRVYRRVAAHPEFSQAGIPWDLDGMFPWDCNPEILSSCVK